MKISGRKWSIRHHRGKSAACGIALDGINLTGHHVLPQAAWTPVRGIDTCNNESKRGQPDWNWVPCVGSSKSKALKMPVKKTTKVRADGKLRRIFMDIIGPKSVPSFCGNNYVLICMDNYSRMKRVRFTRGKASLRTPFEYSPQTWRSLRSSQ